MQTGRSWARRAAGRAVGAAYLASVLAAVACTQEVIVVRDLGDADLSAGEDLSSADLTPTPDMACTAQIQSCTGLCGPVTDACTGQTFQCGACPAGLVCDLYGTHACITPKVSCTDLAAECGLTRDSCGNFVQCGTCAGTDQECNPDTNSCAACQAVTCQDLGYECGTAWLGCGPQSNTTSCGDCSAKPDTICNPTYHVCESTVPTGKTARQLCDDAKASRGIECGIITNLNGGTVDCSQFAEYQCPAGQACNTRGIANRCDPAEPPLECIAAGFNCGTMPSACGGTLDCGECQVAGEICNIAAGQTAGVCGPACTMPQKTCAADYVGVCGKQLDNNCWPKLDCDCDPSMVCSTSTPGQPGTCATAKTCGDYTTGMLNQPCSNGPAAMFPRGDGSNLACGCTGGLTCVDGSGTTVSGGNVGTCKQVSTCATLAPNRGTLGGGCNDNATYDNGAGGFIACPCTGGRFCANDNGTPGQQGQCTDYNTCATHGANGDPSDPCSNGNAFADGNGGNLTCACDPGNVCINGANQVVSGSNKGNCCTTSTCGGAGTACSITDVCTNQTINCTGNGLICVGGMLTPTPTCDSLGHDGSVNDQCSNGAAFDRGDGVLLTCRCDSGLACVNGSNMPVSGSTKGTCKQPLTCATLAPNRNTLGGACSDSQVFDNGVGGKIACPCTNGLVCDNDSNQVGMCVDAKVCADYGANGGAGNPCSNDPATAFDRGDGVGLECNCSGGRVCISGAAPSPVVSGNNTGTCCQPTSQSCNGGCNKTITTNSCTGATQSCSCNSNQYCDAPSNGTCQPKKTCATLGKGGVAGNACNDYVYYDDGSGGAPDLACPCSTAAQPNNACLNDSPTQEGTCQCVPTPCPAGMVGQFFNGCATITCMGG